MEIQNKESWLREGDFSTILSDHDLPGVRKYNDNFEENFAAFKAPMYIWSGSWVRRSAVNSCLKMLPEIDIDLIAHREFRNVLGWANSNLIVWYLTFQFQNFFFRVLGNLCKCSNIFWELSVAAWKKVFFLLNIWISQNFYQIC